jgi:hypothetical protein
MRAHTGPHINTGRTSPGRRHDKRGAPRDAQAPTEGVRRALREEAQAVGRDDYAAKVMLEDAQEFEADEQDLGPPPISEAGLEAALQEENEAMADRAFIEPPLEVAIEPLEPEIDLTSGAIHSASLFDQVTPEDEDTELEAGTLEPALHTEDPSEFAEARDREIRRVRHELLKKRQRAEAIARAEAGDDKS